MKRKGNIKPELKLLSLLAVHKEYEQYKMPKATKISYRTILRHLKPLEKQGYIRFRTEPAEKGGKDKKIYRITLKGLISCLYTKSENLADLEKIIKTHPNMLLTFKKWSLIEKAGLKQLLLERIQKAIRYLLDFIIDLKRKGLHPGFRTEEDARTTLDSMILWATLVADRNEAFAKICKEDPELKQFIDSEFRLREQDHKELQETEAWWSGKK